MSAKPFIFYQVKRVFLACPGDLVAERSKFQRLINTVNNLRAHSLGFHLEAVGWERVIPSFGRPQDLINKELKLADLAVVMFWNRIGSPSSTNSSRTGTVEEFDEARRLYAQVDRPLVWVYFRKKIQTEEVDEQLESVQGFRNSIENEKNLFFREYESTDEWEEMFQQHLVAYLDGLERWDLDSNVYSMRPEAALMKGTFLGEGIYKFGTILLLSADLDGDGNQEELEFKSEHGQFSLMVRKFNKGFFLPLPDWENSGISLDSAKTIHLAIKDVTNDGLPEILLAVSDGVSLLKIAIYGFNSFEGKKSRVLDVTNFNLIAELPGQSVAHVFEGGTIVLPYGSHGLNSSFVWNGLTFDHTD